MLIGREKEKQSLIEAAANEYSQFIAVYGRRRVGKTFLIRETFNYKFAFQFTGAARTSTKKQLARFRQALKEQGLKDVALSITNWLSAFAELRRLINQMPNGKKVIFFDELPWMDAPRSDFLSELESFWNGWASARKDIVFIVCGSSTSWMVKKIIKNKGGLHNRLTHRIALKPFSLRLCEQLVQYLNIEMTRKQVLEAYMIFGGVPYYWTLLKPGASLAQEVDRLIFNEDGELHDEFSMLYSSLFSNPEPFMAVISILAAKKMGMTRKELVKAGKFSNNGRFSEVLHDLEWCGFIRSYSMPGRIVKEDIYQLIDSFTLFYYTFLHGKHPGHNFWLTMQDKPQYNTWCGLAFERVCLWHVEQIKSTLGIAGILTNEYAWRYTGNKEKGIPGTQIDLLIQRSDGITDLCEIKYSSELYAITASYDKELNTKKAVFSRITKTRNAVHIVMVTTFGLARNKYFGTIQNEINIDDLFAI
ncbi:MAG: AAA family ATPase [Muribaculaceae bacterium]|nr:AAA family ATPase [Muribaculaceae bacterium]